MHEQHRGRMGVGSFAWGFVSCASLWSSSTDFHTLCETATKLGKERDGDRIGKMFPYEDSLFIFLPPSFFLSLSLLLSLHLCFSVVAH